MCASLVPSLQFQADQPSVKQSSMMRVWSIFSGKMTGTTENILSLASFPGLQSPNAVEGLVKLLRRMTPISAFQFQYAETSLLFSLLCNTKCRCFLKNKDTCILVIQDV